MPTNRRFDDAETKKKKNSKHLSDYDCGGGAVEPIKNGYYDETGETDVTTIYTDTSCRTKRTRDGVRRV